VVELPEVLRLLEYLLHLPVAAAYAVIAAGSALENIFPPVPSDTFVVLGAFLVDRGSLQALPILLFSWLANVAGAMTVYGIAEKKGPSFFHEGWGVRVLRPHQFARVSRFYRRYGLWAIFVSRFLPVLRVVIPTFAGFTHLGFIRTVIPVAAASLIWNGALLWMGMFASRNVGRILELLGQANGGLLVVTGILLGGFAYWWVRSRREEAPESEEGREEAGTSTAGVTMEEAIESAAQARRKPGRRRS